MGPARWYHTDHQGSIVSVSDSLTAPIAINRYDDWGVPDASNMGRFQYTGQAWIPELGMYHYKARIYSPTLGRFLQTDPIGYDDQVNLYAYVGNDPVNGVDPTGMQCIVPDGGECTVDGRTPPSGLPAGTRIENGDALLAKRSAEPKSDDIVVTAAKKLGQCALDQIGLGEVGSAAAAASGANVLPTRGKPSGAVPGTSPASRAAGAVFGDARVPGGTRLPTVTGWPRMLGGAGMNLRRTASVARIAGRGVPVLGWVLLAYDAGSVANCAISDD